LEDACHKYRLGRSEFVERDFEKAGDFFGIRNLRLLLKTKAVNNYYRRVSKYFASDKLRQAFSLQTMYLGLSPFEAPAVYSLLPYTELAEDGLWFPEGGMYSLILAMERLAGELGVKFHLDSPVEKVVVTKGKATGVRVNGEELDADAVLANADLPYVYRELLGGAADGDFRLRKRGKLEYTASAFMLYLGVDGKLDDMVHHNFYLSRRYEENFRAIFRDRELPDDPSFYAVVPTKTEPRMAPDGTESGAAPRP
jgi:phytoene desaturase